MLAEGYTDLRTSQTTRTEVCFGFSLILGYNLVKGSSPSIRAPGPFLREIGGLVILSFSKLKER